MASSTPIPFGFHPSASGRSPRTETNIFGRPKRAGRSPAPERDSIPEELYAPIQDLIERCGVPAGAPLFESFNGEHFLTFTCTDKYGVKRTIRLTWLKHAEKGQHIISASMQWIPLKHASAPSGRAIEVAAETFPGARDAFLLYWEHSRFPPDPASAPT